MLRNPLCARRTRAWPFFFSCAMVKFTYNLQIHCVMCVSPMDNVYCLLTPFESKLINYWRVQTTHLGCTSSHRISMRTSATMSGLQQVLTEETLDKHTTFLLFILQKKTQLSSLWALSAGRVWTLVYLVASWQIIIITIISIKYLIGLV